MIFTELTKKAHRISFEAHKEQKDKSGMPYVYHPYRVAEKQTSETAVCTALLHDLLEDTPWTADDLRSEGFPEDVIEAIRLMTHPDDVPYMDYVRKIKQNPIAAQVKLADLEDNSDLSRLSYVDDAALRRAGKYAQARYILLDQTNRQLAEKAEAKIRSVIAQSAYWDDKAYAYWHVQAVSQFAILLALKRGQNHQLAAVAGWLHDIHTFTTGDGTEHAIRGAELILKDERLKEWLLPDELEAVCQAIRHHSAKAQTDAPLDECLKDADVMAHYLENAGHLSPVEKQRFDRILQEWTK